MGQSANDALASLPRSSTRQKFVSDFNVLTFGAVGLVYDSCSDLFLSVLRETIEGVRLNSAGPLFDDFRPLCRFDATCFFVFERSGPVRR